MRTIIYNADKEAGNINIENQRFKKKIFSLKNKLKKERRGVEYAFMEILDSCEDNEVMRDVITNIITNFKRRTR